MKKQNLLFLGMFLTLCFSMLTGIAVKGEINTLKSYKATITPTIDGTFTEAEWADAYHTSFYHEPNPISNHPNDTIHIYIKNTQDKLYILFDDLPDNTSENYDNFYIYFDCNYDNLNDSNIKMHLDRDQENGDIGNSMVQWVMGFGISPNKQDRNHTIMEFAINITFSSSYDGTSRPDEMNNILPVGNSNNTIRIMFDTNQYVSGWMVPQSGNISIPSTYAELTLTPPANIPFGTPLVLISILIIATVSIGWTVSRKKLTIN
ncbi:MAG: hypothetical protein GF311_06515 [Candidatus Lokiarchaeota archaeon]|nr:hypothetical protein [Candidatus Lokiarchaeota archaeon]